jgi:hypothetical protein
VLHNKDNKAEVGLPAEDRWVSHGAMALLRNSMKAMVPLEGTCKPEGEEVIRKEMVAKFTQLHNPENSFDFCYELCLGVFTADPSDSCNCPE